MVEAQNSLGNMETVLTILINIKALLIKAYDSLGNMASVLTI